MDKRKACPIFLTTFLVLTLFLVVPHNAFFGTVQASTTTVNEPYFILNTGESRGIQDDNGNTIIFTVTSGTLQGFASETQTATLQDGGQLILYPETNGTLTVTSNIGLRIAVNSISYDVPISFSLGNTYNIIWGNSTTIGQGTGTGSNPTPTPTQTYTTPKPTGQVILQPGNSTTPIPTTMPIIPINWLTNPVFDIVIVIIMLAILVCVVAFSKRRS